MNLYRKLLLAQMPIALALLAVCAVSVFVSFVSRLPLPDDSQRQLSQRSGRAANEGGDRANGQRGLVFGCRAAPESARAVGEKSARSSRPS